jgi:hypothetical protein
LPKADSRIRMPGFNSLLSWSPISSLDVQIARAPQASPSARSTRLQIVTAHLSTPQGQRRTMVAVLTFSAMSHAITEP